MWVVACTPLRLNAFAVSASIAARTTGAYSGLHPAITMLIASTSRLRLPCRGGTLHSTKSGSPPSAATNASTRSRVGGTTGSPSVQPCAKYHSTRSVPAGTRRVFACNGSGGFAASCDMLVSRDCGSGRGAYHLQPQGRSSRHRILPDPEAVQQSRWRAWSLVSGAEDCGIFDCGHTANLNRVYSQPLFGTQWSPRFR